MAYKLSVLVAAINAEPTIRDTFASISRQSLKDCEVRFVVAPSVDRTLELIKDFCYGDDAKNWEFDEGHGIYEAYNQAARSAEGEYLMYLNADDWLAEDAIENILDFLKENPGAEYVNFATQYYSFTKEPGKKVSGVRKLPPFLLMPMCFPATIFRRDALLGAGGFDTSYPLVADYDLILRFLGVYGQPLLSNSLVHCFRRDGRSSFERSFLDIFRIVRHHFGIRKAIFGLVFRGLVKAKGAITWR